MLADRPVNVRFGAVWSRSYLSEEGRLMADLGGPISEFKCRIHLQNQTLATRFSERGGENDAISPASPAPATPSRVERWD